MLLVNDDCLTGCSGFFHFRKQVAPKFPWSMEGLMLLPLNNAHQRGGFLVSNNDFVTDLNSCANLGWVWLRIQKLEHRVVPIVSFDVNPSILLQSLLSDRNTESLSDSLTLYGCAQFHHIANFQLTPWLKLWYTISYQSIIIFKPTDDLYLLAHFLMKVWHVSTLAVFNRLVLPKFMIHVT